jgi:hypothetical protein
MWHIYTTEYYSASKKILNAVVKEDGGKGNGK